MIWVSLQGTGIEPQACQADLNGDFRVDDADLDLFTDDFGRLGVSSTADIDLDGDIDAADLSILANEFGRQDCQ